VSGPHDDLVARLEALVADLDERAFDLLREAAREGGGRPDDDKRLVQARRALEKAIRLLSGGSATSDE
jgi:hypothetical protein